MCIIYAVQIMQQIRKKNACIHTDKLLKTMLIYNLHNLQTNF